MAPGGSCKQPAPSYCDPRGTLRVLPNGQCECKELVTGPRCDQCTISSFLLKPKTVTGCVNCFCSAVTQTCTSSSWYRDSVRASFTPNRHEFTVITDYENPVESSLEIETVNGEVAIRPSSADSAVYFWRLPSHFAGNKITAYGGFLNYTVRFVPTPGGGLSRNNAPDVVIRSENDITVLHYHHDNPTGASQSYVVPIYEESWERVDGKPLNREYLLMALADVSDVFIKATYTTTTQQAGLSQASLDTASPHNTGSFVRAVEVEQCSCPLGYKGLSCEDCAPGYTRSLGGLYLGLCERCECNGHSDECDPERGTCQVSY